MIRNHPGGERCRGGSIRRAWDGENVDLVAYVVSRGAGRSRSNELSKWLADAPLRCHGGPPPKINFIDEDAGARQFQARHPGAEGKLDRQACPKGSLSHRSLGFRRPRHEAGQRRRDPAVEKRRCADRGQRLLDAASYEADHSVARMPAATRSKGLELIFLLEEGPRPPRCAWRFSGRAPPPEAKLIARPAGRTRRTRSAIGRPAPGLFHPRRQWGHAPRYRSAWSRRFAEQIEMVILDYPMIDMGHD